MSLPPTKESGKPVTVTADEYNVLLVRSVKLEDERDALRETLAGLLRMMRPEWIPDAQREARRALGRPE